MTFTTGSPHTNEPRTEHEAVLRAFGLTGPEAELDAFAAQLAQEIGVPYAMINIFGSQQQFFGLHTPGNDSDLPTVGRAMPLDHGFCPEVVTRKKPLVLPDVFAHPRFAGNAVVDQIGIRTYAGAPLLHGDTVLGTVCAVGPVERDKSTGRDTLALIKHHRDAVMNFLNQRSGMKP
ncbi:GAF domain-containing protein [Streptomyces sp. NPDC058659]|uniref:GAF domain-containing protein n=1 Tax=Streptomyces sp. NPDC058659 TaxID=3346581 RepID=UPI00365059A6